MDVKGRKALVFNTLVSESGGNTVHYFSFFFVNLYNNLRRFFVVGSERE